MRSVPSILLAVAYTATGIAASPASTAVEIEPDLFMTTYEFGQMALNSSFSIGGGSADASLTKRTHEQCWDNHLTAHQNQQDYEDDCDILIEGLRRASRRTRELEPKNSILYATSRSRCKIIVRNQSSCITKTLVDSWVGADARDTLNHCPNLSQCSGWGLVNNDRDLIYMLEPYEVAPPTYSPRCQ
ncbi:hypothetical protein NQ176_g5377 [Zarea fungicola]|uniref:Uncharacterized protein n=1 Tax=Zarea fungicola TaxID=93591 RepID=A0ACC1NB38_9HYPO|nr:hypothetical protein NQ176_g5377 [Lecanicillium fungicola]